jgi:ATP/maltotriose-dependent transcriptional regulator MalT
LSERQWDAARRTLWPRPAVLLRAQAGQPARDEPIAALAAVSFGSDDNLVSQYMESEFLARISPRQRVFLTRTAVLERMSGALCEAVLELSGAAATLADLARSNMLLVPLDRRGQWYRYHHLFRDMLLADLERQEPGLITVLPRATGRSGVPASALGSCVCLLGNARPPKLARWAGSTPSWR